jgi:hypothetical protein
MPSTPAQPPQPQPWSNQYGSYAPPVQQPPQQQYNAEANLTYGDVNRIAPDLINQAVNPQFQNVYQSLAQQALDSVKRDNGAIFDKYGPEVYSYLAKVPINDRTVDNITTIVKLVRGNHVEEIGREIAGRLVAEMEPQLRSNGSPSLQVAQSKPEYTLQSENIPKDWKDRAAQAGLTEQAVEEFCRANDMTPKDFYTQFGTQAITEGSRG